MSSEIRPRIFVSSIMTGYGDVREAAARAIEKAGCEAVLAERFPAGTASPRTACLDGVASSDGIALILGPRYGENTAAGISATEEEYREAVRLKKQIFVFLESREREARQQEFVSSVEDYVDGHWRKSFDAPEKLAALVEQAIREGEPMVASGNIEGGARERIGAAMAERPDNAEVIVWAQIAWTTPRNEEVLDPTRFMDRSFQKEVQRLAHESNPSLFDYSQAKETDFGASRLRVSQMSDKNQWREARDLVVVDLHENGTLSVSLNLTGLVPREPADMGELFRVDPTTLSERLEQAWGFAYRWWEHIDPYHRHEPLLYNVALHDVGSRRLEAAPAQRQTGYTVPATCPHNPLWIYDRPRKAVRRDLREPQEEIKHILDMTKLRFKDWEGNRW